MALLARRAQIAIKQQTAVGTPATLAAANAVVDISNPVFTPEFESLERDLLSSSLSPAGKISGRQSATLSFSTELKTEGAALIGTAPELNQLFRACGYGDANTATETTYTPSSAITVADGHLPFTIGFYVDGVRYLMQDAMGDFTINLPIGGIPTVDWVFTGLYSSKTDVALLATTAPSSMPQPFIGVTFTIDSQTPCFGDMTIAAGNTVTLQECVTESTGYKQAQITDRNPTGSFTPELTLQATYDYVAKMAADTELAFSLQIGSVDGEIVTITAPAVQVDSVGFTSTADGIAAEDIGLRFVRDANDDELSILFT